ncbi:phospholipase D/nuclease [Atractiella rhizophila]|nr:phospholipase D/nuclease [Atractiella rhizophila]
MNFLTKLAKELTVDLPENLERLHTQVVTTLNPNHRHDEEYEKEQDRIRTEIAESHRFTSFAPVRQGNNVKWYIDGHDYFWALSEMLDSARECIFILDWWLTPELYLRRPPEKHEDYRLDRILKRKAEQGVKVYIIVYKEVTQTMTMSSAHTKHFLEDAHRNIAVMRHPDHIGGDVTLYWSHHEKVVVVDNIMACIGGLDICFGRWDTHSFPMSDIHPFDFSLTLFPGQDYNNARIQDFQNVDKWASNQQSRTEIGRMPWHDTHMTMVGPIVMDIAQHYVERWNFVKASKYKSDDRYDWLAFPHTVDFSGTGRENEEFERMEQREIADHITRHPHWEMFKKVGRRFTAHERNDEDAGMHSGRERGKKGGMTVQALRSSADWSHGILTEHSIQNAYIQLIREANHFIYIENQFFISNTMTENGVVKNLIAMALVERILQAAKAGKKFKVIVLIPAIPGFAGDVKDSASLLAIMGFTYKTICRGGTSIMELIEKAGYNPSDYISFYNLRSYDRLSNSPEVLKEMEQRSGMTFLEAQAAQVRIYLGDNPSQKDLEANSKVKFKKAQVGESLQADVKSADGDIITLDLPTDIWKAREMVKRWQEAAPSMERRVKNSINHHALKSGGSIFDEPWVGDEETEKMAYVTEVMYIHTKLMIVDDRRVIMGSANLNDRSQNGDHDSEIACVVEDTNMVESEMNGEKYMASQFATTLRRQLMKYHLGLAPPQYCPPHEEPSDAMHPVGTPQVYEFDTEEDLAIRDPLSDSFERLWKGTARQNADLFEQVFHCVPAKNIPDWATYKTFVPQPPMKVGHIASPSMPLSFVKDNIAKIRGHLVEMPLDFLSKEKLVEGGLEVNLATVAIYI